MMPSTRNLLVYWMPVFVYAAGIFIQSSFPPAAALPDVPGSDKLLHALAYAGLAMLVFRALTSTGWSSRPRLLFWGSLLGTAAYGILDELHQVFVPARSAEMLDATADAAGALAAVLLCRWVYRPPTGRS
jgi:VanZ family protein